MKLTSLTILGEYINMKTMMIRIQHRTLIRLRRCFPAEPDETAAHYFIRVANLMKELKEQGYELK
jgi:hypothetical protein